MYGWRARALARIEDLKARGVTMKEISLHAGKNAGWLSETLKNDSNPRIDSFLALADAIGVPAAFLLEGDERFTVRVPTLGAIDGDETWKASRPGASESAFELGSPDVACYRVEGNAMAPAYRDGDEVFCRIADPRHADNLIGKDCVGRTQDGLRFVKILERGSRRGRYRLRSYKPGVPDIEDVELAEIAPIIWIKRGER